MRYTINENMDINRNRIILCKDASFGSNNEDGQNWDFQVSLDRSSSIILNFNSQNYKCVSCEGRLNIKSKNIKNIRIESLSSRKAALIFDSSNVPRYGVEDLIFDQSIGYDRQNNIIVLGNYKFGDELYEFGIGQYVKVLEGEILAVIIRLCE